MKIALVLTVRNEERLLRNNLLYHHAIGIEKVFLYFDNTTDNGKETVKDLDFVQAKESAPASDFNHLPFLSKFTQQASEHHTARQCLNIFDAIEKSEDEGFDWLISLDADELVAADKTGVTDIRSFLRSINEDIDAVRFEVREILQTKKAYENVFEEEILFKRQRSYKRYSFNIFRNLYNPITGKLEKHIYWYGHHAGKMAIRLHRGLIPHNPHRFTDKSGIKPDTVTKGILLHYHSYDAADFIKKYRNFDTHPTTYLSGRQVEELKVLLMDVVNKSGMTPSELQDYFEKYLMFHKKDIKKLLRNRVYFLFKRKSPVLEKISAVNETFREIN